jgi:hypothetical protein
MGAKELFANSSVKGQHNHEAMQVKPYGEVGRSKVELAWVKKLPAPVEAKRPIVE